MVTAASSLSSCAQLLRKAETLKSKVLGNSLASTLPSTDEFVARQDLQRLYKSLLLTDLHYALEKKVELELWNNAFKVHIDCLRHDLKGKKGAHKGEHQARISYFIDASSGFYFELLQEFCEVNNLHLPCRARSGNIFLDTDSSVQHGDKPRQSLCLYVCQDCLVHLGDLARYRSDHEQAATFYRLASSLIPGNGQPYNQLAILSTSKGDHLQAVFYYCKSILVQNQFPAASTNLHKTFVQYCTRQNPGPLLEMSPVCPKNFVTLFIQYHGALYLMQDFGKLQVVKEKLMTHFHELIGELELKDIIAINGINVFSLHKCKPKEEDGGRQCMTADEINAWELSLSIAICFMEEMMRHVKENFTEATGFEKCNPALAGIKILLDWLFCCSPAFARQEVFSKYYSILDLLSAVNEKLQSYPLYERLESDNSVIPLPEDLYLQGFIPLRKTHRKLDFRVAANDQDISLTVLRFNRIIHCYELLQQQDIPRVQQRESVHSLRSAMHQSFLKHSKQVSVWPENDSKNCRPPLTRIYNPIPTNNQVPEEHARSKSPFAETRSLFRTDSEEQGVKVVPDVPPMMTSYSLFHSGWGLQLTKEQMAETPEELLEGPSMDEIFPESNTHSEVFPTSSSDIQANHITPLASQDGYSERFAYGGQGNWCKSPQSKQHPQPPPPRFNQFALLRGIPPNSINIQNSVQSSDFLPLGQTRTPSNSRSYQIGASPNASLMYPSPQVKPVLPPQNNIMYSPSKMDLGLSGQGWAMGLQAPVGTGTPQQNPSSSIPSDSIWGGSLFANGHPAGQSIWSPSVAAGTSVMSPLQQLLQEQKKHQRPK